MSPDPIDQLAAAVLRACLPDPADRLCAAFRASLDGDALDDLLIAALVQAAADPDFMAPVPGGQLARQRGQADLEARFRAFQARQEAKYGGLFDRLQPRGPGLSVRAWC